MIEMSQERIKQILEEETVKTEELATILRSVYTRYMHLYEKYFADTDALDDAAIAGLKDYHEETKSLVKYYYMDITWDDSTGSRDYFLVPAGAGFEEEHIAGDPYKEDTFTGRYPMAAEAFNTRNESLLISLRGMASAITDSMKQFFENEE